MEQIVAIDSITARRPTEYNSQLNIYTGAAVYPFLRMRASRTYVMCHQIILNAVKLECKQKSLCGVAVAPLACMRAAVHTSR